MLDARYQERDHPAAEAAARPAAALGPARPRRAARRRLRVAERADDPRLRSYARLQSAAASPTCRTRPARATTSRGREQRTFSPLFHSYRSLIADMLGLRYIVSSVHDRRGRPQPQARRSALPRAHARRLRLRKPARAAARAVRRELAGGGFRLADRARPVARFRSAPHRAARSRCGRRTAAAAQAGGVSARDGTA